MENKTHTGKIVWFSPKKGYGFIEWYLDNVKQKDIFIHFSDILMEGFKTINADQKVSFEIGINKNNDPKAINVMLLITQ